MNERIKELAIEAFFDEATSQTSNKMYNFSEYKLEKFAELIIKECAEVANDKYDKGRCPVGHFINEHFCVD